MVSVNQSGLQKHVGVKLSRLAKCAPHVRLTRVNTPSEAATKAWSNFIRRLECPTPYLDTYIHRIVPAGHASRGRADPDHLLPTRYPETILTTSAHSPAPEYGNTLVLATSPRTRQTHHVFYAIICVPYKCQASLRNYHLMAVRHAVERDG